MLMQSYISHPRGTVFNLLIIFCNYLALLIATEFIGNCKRYETSLILFYRKYDAPGIWEKSIKLDVDIDFVYENVVFCAVRVLPFFLRILKLNSENIK